MKHLWSPKSKSRVCSNHFSENIQGYPTVNLGYNAKSKVKLLVPAVAGSKRSLTYTSSTNNSGQSISTNRKHGTPKQDNADLCSSSSESVLDNFKNLPLPSSSTPLIKRPKNQHNLENTNNNNSSQVLEPDIDLQIMSYDEKIQRKKLEHVNELYILQNQYLNDVQMLKLQVQDLENKNRMLRNSNAKLTQTVGKL